jgi:hypothetical protein
VAGVEIELNGAVNPLATVVVGWPVVPLARNTVAQVFATLL